MQNVLLKNVKREVASRCFIIIKQVCLVRPVMEALQIISLLPVPFLQQLKNNPTDRAEFPRDKS
jgi:hypothetical protein